jgi:hypothetical protein
LQSPIFVYKILNWLNMNRKPVCGDYACQYTFLLSQGTFRPSDLTLSTARWSTIHQRQVWEAKVSNDAGHLQAFCRSQVTEKLLRTSGLTRSSLNRT